MLQGLLQAVLVLWPLPSAPDLLGCLLYAAITLAFSVSHGNTFLLVLPRVGDGGRKAAVTLQRGRVGRWIATTVRWRLFLLLVLRGGNRIYDYRRRRRSSPTDPQPRLDVPVPGCRVAAAAAAVARHLGGDSVDWRPPSHPDGLVATDDATVHVLALSQTFTEGLSVDGK